MLLYSLSSVPWYVSSGSASSGDLAIGDGLLDGVVWAIAFHCRRLRDAGSRILFGGRVS